MQIPSSAIGDRIRAIREDKGLNQEQFSSILEVSRVSVSEIERGRTKPSLKIIQSIMMRFAAYSHWLITGEGPMYRTPEVESKSLRDLLTERSKGYSEILCRLIDESKEELQESIDRELEAKADKTALIGTQREVAELREVMKEKFPEAFDEPEAEPCIELPDYGMVAAAGPVAELDHHRQIRETFPVRESLLPRNRENLFVGHIRGGSMADIIPDGSKLLLRIAKSPISGRVYLFTIRGQATIKKFRVDHTGPHFEYMDGSGRSIYPEAGEQWHCNAEFLAVLG